MTFRLAMISEHASPLGILGGTDSGGQNVYVAQLARHLARRGHAVDVFTRRDAPGLPDVVDWLDGVRVIHVPAGPASYVRKEDLLPWMEPFARFVGDWARHQRLRYDLLHANFWMSGLVAESVARERGIPWVITFHALGKVRRLYQGAADEFPPDRLPIEQRLIRSANAIVAECPQDREDLLRLYDAVPERIAMIPCGFDTDELQPVDQRVARQRLGIRPDERVVLQLGRMVPRKGVDTAIEAVGQLVQRYEIAARLLIVGGESDDPDPALTPEIGRLRQIARQVGIDGHVTFVGRRRREALCDYFSAADVFVSVPWYEPFGMTPIEAMACGTPVIGSAVGGIKFTVRDGVTGFLVPPKNPTAVADRLAYLFQRPALLQSMRSACVRHVGARFTWPIVAESMEGLYHEVVSTAERLHPRRIAVPLRAPVSLLPSDLIGAMPGPEAYPS